MTEQKQESMVDMDAARRDDASRILAGASFALILAAVVMFFVAAELTTFEIAKTLLGCGITGLLLWLAVLSVKR